MAKAVKKRAEKYEEKPAINAPLDQLVKPSATDADKAIKKEAKKEEKPKKKGIKTDKKK
jgi:hypothetical protein